MLFFKKYQWLLPSLLFTCSLILLRVYFVGHFSYLFIPWNLVLAGLPLLFSFQAGRLKGSSRILWIFLWLLFFPNSMYIITDLFHLEDELGVPKWLDLLLLFSAAFNGLFMGLMSLKNIENLLASYLPGKTKILFSAVIFLLCGYGIYLGRYERWNSWDLFTHPISLAKDIALDFLYPIHHRHVWTITIYFGGWLMIVHQYLSKFAPQENPDK